MRWYIPTIALLLSIGVTDFAHAANPVCGHREDILQQLSSQYKEAPVAVGLTDSGVLVELLSSDNGATWTILVSQENGTTCLVAAGQHWQNVKDDAEKPSKTL